MALGTTIGCVTNAGSLDIVGAPRGAPPYEGLSARSVTTHIADVELRVAGLDDLVAMKRAAGRPLDLQDIADLTEPRD